MTRKDYILIAAAIKASAQRNDLDIWQVATSSAARELCEALASDYPRFDRERFLKACGVT